MRSRILAIALMQARLPFPAHGLDAGLPAYQPERAIAGEINAAGDASMRPMMEAWLAALAKTHPGLRQGTRGRFVQGSSPFGALMFETVDVAALARDPIPSEVAPYAPQFAGDM